MGQESLESWYRNGRRFEYRGHRIYYRTAGDGADTVLLLHGFPTASWDWRAIWPTLSRRFRLVAADMLGFGFSPKPRDHPYSLFDQANLQEALLDELGLRRIHLLAHDYGDSVAQELLARQREGSGRVEVLSVALLNGGVFPEASRPRLVQRCLKGPLGPLVARLIRERTFRRSLRAVFAPATRPSDEEMGQLWQLVSRDGGVRVAHRLIGYLRERRRHRERWVDAICGCPVPLRLIWGMWDPVSGESVLRRGRELIPELEVVELTEVGHYPQLEAPGAVAAAYLEHLGAVRLG